MFRGFVVGLMVGVLLLVGGVYYYFVSGMAPAAAADAPMPFEKTLAGKSLGAHIDNAKIPPSPLQPNEENLLAGAKLYKDECAGCHGLPDMPPPAIADSMYPHATLMFKGKGVSDDPPSESYWKIVNGIRLTGMPSFKGALSDTQLWQVALLVASTDKLPDSAKRALAPDPPKGAISPFIAPVNPLK